MLQLSSMLPVWVILFSSHAAAAGGDVLTTTTSIQSFSENTNVKTLHILKEELQKNNDDYKDKSLNGESVKSANQSLLSRRALSAEPKTEQKAKPQAEPAPVKPKKYSSVATARNPKYVNKHPVTGDHNKVDKLRSFLDKYKVIVNEFMANHSESTPAAPRRHHAPVGAAFRLGAAREPQQGHSAAVEGPVPRARDAPAGLDHRLPSAAQLDMSPARGGRVDTLRNKNRLCHRHVMIPEGPKYDSHGKVYLAQYTPVRDREYAQTRKPRILLPKCCNCCRKSVLGCE